MEPYSLHFAERALSELEQLDTPLTRRITKRIQWLTENLDKLTPQPLTGQFTGFQVARWRLSRAI